MSETRTPYEFADLSLMHSDLQNRYEVALDEIARLRGLLGALFDHDLVVKDTVDGDARLVLQSAALEVDFNRALAKLGFVDLESRSNAWAMEDER